MLQLKYNLNEKVFLGKKIEAKVNWSYVGLGGHSGGGGVALDMIMNDTSMAKVKRVIGNQCFVSDLCVCVWVSGCGCVGGCGWVLVLAHVKSNACSI